MASAFKIGEEVEQIVSAPITGTIVERRVAGDDDLFLVEWIDENGDPCSRWFNETEIKLIA